MALPSYDFSGIVSTADQSEAIYLPLKSLNVHIFIADVSARVILSQVYQYHGSDTLSETYYVFPVPANAAVCSFEMKTTNGVRLKGIVKELSQAKEEYQEARDKGWLTGLLEQFRQDVFVVSIGSMPPNTDVTVLLSYVENLSEDDQIDTVRFQLSSHVRARYGAPVNSAVYHDTTHNGLLSITVDIEMPGDILDVTSWNHNPFIDLPVPPIAACSPGASRSRRFVRKQFDSGYFDFGKDILLIVHALGLGKPRCFAERLSPEENSLRSVIGPTTAFALTITPRFDLKIRPAQEYIFMIDRSGSMAGSNINMARQALELLLTQLPSTDSMFNIYSFGSTFQSMWHESQPYTDATLFEATSHITNMDANMGGTELLGALNHSFLSRRRYMPTCIFVLTDGEIYAPHAAIEHVRQAVSKASQSGVAPLRVFTLGIGSGASTYLCQGLATAGNGAHLMTVEGEPLAFKAKRLVNAMQNPQVKEMSVDWGGLNPALHGISAFSPGMRLLVTAIVPGEQVPTEITLRLSLLDGTPLNYNVPVETLSHHIPSSLTDALGGLTEVPPLIHTLCAHILIQDVEGGDTEPLGLQKGVTLSPGTRRDIVKRYIVELGTRYQIASSRTAFIAVAAPNPSMNPPRQDKTSNRRDSRSKHSSHSTSQGDGSTTGRSTSHNQESKNGHTKGTQGPRSQTGRKSDARNSATSGANAHSTPSKGSSPVLSRRQEGSTNGGQPPDDDEKQGNGNGKQGSNSKTNSKPDEEGSKTSHGNAKSSPSTTNNGSPASQHPPKGSSNPPTHTSRPEKGSISGTSSDPEDKQSQSPTSRMPGAFRQSPRREATGPGWVFDIFAHKPSPESVPVAEVICVPNPQGGNPTFFTAPPLLGYTTITTMASSWLKSLQSFIFPKNPPGGPKRSSKGPVSAFKARQEQVPEAVLTVARLQSFNGSFSGISRELSSLVRIPESQLRIMAPSMAYGANNESVWATAIAVAYCRKKLFRHVTLWEDMAEKAQDYGSKVCGSSDMFQNIVQEALKLFQS